MKKPVLRHYVKHPLVNVALTASYNQKGHIEITSVDYRLNHQKDHGATADGYSEELLDSIAGMIEDYLNGERVSFSSVKIDLSEMTDFQKCVLRAARKIPRAKQVSYKELAAMAGYPGAVRAAASVMRNNPCPLIIPCHRVVKSNGDIGGFMGKMSGKCVELKRKLIELEKKGPRKER